MTHADCNRAIKKTLEGLWGRGKVRVHGPYNPVIEIDHPDTDTPDGQRRIDRASMDALRQTGLSFHGNFDYRKDGAHMPRLTAVVAKPRRDEERGDPPDQLKTRRSK